MSSFHKVHGSRPLPNQASCSTRDAIIYAFIAAFEVTTIYAVAEAVIKLLLTFRYRRGLYFWSLLVTALGCGFSAFSLLLKFFVDGTPWALYTLINMFAWWAMVTGQSIILWSRLHLVFRDKGLLRFMLCVIITNAVCLHIPTSVITWGFFSPNSTFWAPMFEKVDKVQSTAFFVQESVLAAFYIRSASRLLSSLAVKGSSHSRQLFYRLIVMNLIVIAFGTILLSLEFTDNWVMEINLKPLLFILKLKMEFNILNKLVTLAHLSSAGRRDSDAYTTADDGSNPTGDATNDPTASPKDRNNYRMSWTDPFLGSSGIAVTTRKSTIAFKESIGTNNLGSVLVETASRGDGSQTNLAPQAIPDADTIRREGVEPMEKILPKGAVATSAAASSLHSSGSRASRASRSGKDSGDVGAEQPRIPHPVLARL